MKTHLLQIRLSDRLKQRLEKVADSYEVPVSTLVRFIIAEFSHNADRLRITPNGFTLDEEEKILLSERQTDREIQQGKADIFPSFDKALSGLGHGSNS